MVDLTETFAYSDQPVTCPKCGSRTDIILDLSHTSEQTQVHKCLFDKCQFEFFVEIDNDFNEDYQ